jgi:hypothetical protein
LVGFINTFLSFVIHNASSPVNFCQRSSFICPLTCLAFALYSSTADILVVDNSVFEVCKILCLDFIDSLTSILSPS